MADEQRAENKFKVLILTVENYLSQAHQLNEALATYGPAIDLECILTDAGQIPDINPYDVVIMVSEDLHRHISFEDTPHITFFTVAQQPIAAPWIQAHYPMDEPPQHIAQQLHADLKLAELTRINQAITALAQAANHAVDQEATNEILFSVLRKLTFYTGANLAILEERYLRVEGYDGYAPADISIMLSAHELMNIPSQVPVFLKGETHHLPVMPRSERAVFPWLRSWAGIPIEKHSGVIAVLNIDGIQPNQIRALHVQRLEQVTPQIAALLETRQLYETLKNTNSLIRALSRQSSFLFTPIATYESLSQLCQAVVDTVLTSFGATDCGVLLIEDSTSKLVRCARAGQYDVQASAPLYIDGGGLVPEAIRNESVVYAPDVHSHESYLPHEPRTCSELVIPLQTRDGIIGALDLQSIEYDAFSIRDQQSLIAFGEHVAASIANFQTYQRQRDYTRNLEERVQERTAALNHAKERVEAILNRATDALVLLDPQGRIEQANSAFNRLFRVHPDTLFQQPIQTLVTKESRPHLVDVIEQAQAGDRHNMLEVRMLNSNRQTFEAEVTISAVRLAGNPANDQSGADMVCSIRDISHHKTIQNRLEQSLETEREVSRLKTRFILTVSHEFRTPLTVILSSSDLLHTRGHKMNEAQRQKHFDRIQAEVRHMEGMLDDALIVSQTEEGDLSFQPQQVNITQLGRKTTEMYNREYGHPAIDFVTEGEDITVPADPTLIRHIIDNLLTNAIKYAEDTDEIRFAIHRQEENVVIEVEDGGIGIPEKDMESLFKPFFRAYNVGTISGSGLGLSIVKSAVQKHQGTIDVFSDSHGTLFRVSLPAKASEHSTMDG